MNYRILGLVAMFVLPGVFVYLVGAFLMSTFNINLWYDGQRFFAVVAYLFIIFNIPEALNRSDKKDNKPKAKVNLENKEVKEESTFVA